jgi:hypothetical protein
MPLVRVQPLPDTSTSEHTILSTSALSHPLPLKFCSLFRPALVSSQPSPTGLAYQLLPSDRSAPACSVPAKILNVAKRHSRYQFLMNFRLHGSRFASALSIVCHVVSIIVLVFELAVLYHEVTGNNTVSNGASKFCNTQCLNSGICSSFEEPPKTAASPISSLLRAAAPPAAPSNSSTRPPDSCSCLPGFYGDTCQLDLRSSEVKKTGYSFSTQLFKQVYEQAMIYMIFITACLCLILLSFMRSIHSAFVINETISRIRPFLGSTRYHSFAAAKPAPDSCVCDAFITRIHFYYQKSAAHTAAHAITSHPVLGSAAATGRNIWSQWRAL